MSTDSESDFDYTQADHEALMARIRQFQDDGLLWLVNTAILHPRGYALAVFRQEGEIVGLGLLGDGTEPWVYPVGHEAALEGSVYDRYERGEFARYQRRGHE